MKPAARGHPNVPRRCRRLTDSLARRAPGPCAFRGPANKHVLSPGRSLKFPGHSLPRRGPFTGSSAVLSASTPHLLLSCFAHHCRCICVTVSHAVSPLPRDTESPVGPVGPQPPAQGLTHTMGNLKSTFRGYKSCGHLTFSWASPSFPAPLGHCSRSAQPSRSCSVVIHE